MFDEEADEVTAVGELGEFGVLPNHISFLSTLVAGEMSYKQGNIRRFLAVSGGYAEVLDNVMTVLAPSAEFGSEIDVERAQHAKERAERDLADASRNGREEKDIELAQVALQRASVRLQVASKEARR